ncbi:MAG: DNA translocase FtsK 4TM domain-containing protein, partial [Terriglobia bacterium]
SLDTATASATVQNWIGVVGSYTADALLQALGWTAFLIPLMFFIVGGRWIFLRPLAAPRTKIFGAALLMGSLAAVLELVPRVPRVFGVIHGSGLAGYVLAAGLVRTLNPLGGIVVAGAIFVSSLFLVTTFSFSSTGKFLGAAYTELAEPLERRWSNWRSRREKLRLQRRMARERVLGKEPVVSGRAIAPVAAPSAERPAAKASQQLPIASPALIEPEEEEPPPVVMAQVRAQERERGRGAGPQIAANAQHKYKLPSTALLRPPDDQQGIDERELKERALQLTNKFAEFGVMGSVTQIHPGPVVTTFEFKPEAGIKYSRITNLVDDLCLAMKAESILIERIPGKSTVGIEVPNLHREIIYLREILESSEFAAPPSRLTLCLGKDITGKVKVGDLAQMPHLLIAGSTGSGKSVAINSFIMSILFRSTPDEV